MNEQILQKNELAKSIKFESNFKCQIRDFIQPTDLAVLWAISHAGACGYDDITQRMLKSQKKMLHMLHMLSNTCPKHATIPKVVKTSIITQDVHLNIVNEKAIFSL